MTIHIELIQIPHYSCSTYSLPDKPNPKPLFDARTPPKLNMSFSATHIDKKRSKWIRDEENGAERRKLRVKKPEDFQNDRTKSYKAKSRELSEPTSGRLAPIPSPLPTAVPTRNASLASVPPGNVQERGYRRPVPGEVAYSPYPVSAVSNTRSPAITNANPTTSPRMPSVAHSTYSTPAASVVSAAKSHASTVSAMQPSTPGNYHPHPPQAVSIPPQVTNDYQASSAVRGTPSTPPEYPLLLPAPRERPRTPSEVSVTPSTASGKCPALPASRDSSRTSSVISAVQSQVLESHPPLPESRVQNYRAPSVISVASSAASVQHPPLSISEVPSEIRNPQPSRSQSVTNASRSVVRENRLLLPASGSRSPSVAPTEVSFIEESSGYLQEGHSRDPSSRALCLRAPSSQPPASRAASVTLSIRSEHAVSIPSAARRRADEVHARSEIGNSSSVAKSSARARRPSVVHREEEYADQVPVRAPSIAASTRSSVKSGHNERDMSIASKARSYTREEEYKARLQSKSTPKRASSIKPSSRSERGISSASKARTQIDVNDHESSSEREPTSKRALSKAISSKSARKVSGDGRGRSTTSRTKSAYDELAEVEVTYDEYEDAASRVLSHSERSKSASTHRSSSVSSVETVRPVGGKHNALVVYRDNALHTAEASKDATRRRSSRRKKKPDIEVRSYVGSDDVTVVLPDPSEVGEAGHASGSQDKQKQQQYLDEYQKWQRQEQRSQQQYQQPYPQPNTRPYPHTYPFQYPQQQQASYPAYVYPNVQPQYPNHQYTNHPYPDPRYTYPQPTAQPHYPTVNTHYESQYVKFEPQPAPYADLAREHEERKQGWHFPKGWDEVHERTQQPVGKSRRKAKYRDADL